MNTFKNAPIKNIILHYQSVIYIEIETQSSFKNNRTQLILGKNKQERHYELFNIW